MLIRTIIAFLLVAASNGSASEPRPTKLPIGVNAPELDVRLLSGAPAPSLKRLRGHVVVVDFWASWCAPCVAAIPHLDEVKKALAKEPIDFYSVTYEPPGKVRAFLDKHPMTTSVATDNDLTTFTKYIAWGIPMAYVIDPHGNIAAVIYPERLTAAALREVLAGRKPDVQQEEGWKDPDGAARYFREQLEADRKTYGRD
jgi:thiol-disulfide isomerase/thioredoxin